MPVPSIHPRIPSGGRIRKAGREREATPRRRAERILRTSGLGFNFLDRPALGLTERERGGGEGGRGQRGTQRDRGTHHTRLGCGIDRKSEMNLFEIQVMKKEIKTEDWQDYRPVQKKS